MPTSAYISLNQKGYCGEPFDKRLPYFLAPRLTRAQWNLLNRRLYAEVTKKSNHLDEYTKWMYVDEEGVQVFAIYGVGDPKGPTVLYAIGGKAALKKHQRMQTVLEGINNGTLPSREDVARFIEELPRWARQDYFGFMSSRSDDASVGNVQLVAGQSGSNRRGDRGAGILPGRSVRSLGEGKVNTDAEASEESGASSVTETRFSLGDGNLVE